ncbi:MAG: preprotein translocase subunit SecE [Candidatus Magasanikbacteria bacterium CG_4_9_14_0_2_um_filter_42_11]|uniref:Protein translocase subunit SecE n=1 Tax=Candidatus Magasanikbacteria bacterium CG_4_9_14_0_2_um_filter_42_11 TaxID=1974643 RepID=A0A2M8FB61_9BACT|nr:MAG: preprotein translocase subunit SecE [Candidatus Magasanikbacteria bacterium CG10_big_fil_rev_8_21_14_0_10_43_9]PIY92095.1 MAG: preprotein translocase subunit SecE [Candidatus Magasanikbacteria bacterium CG_4_10_14_0_8_um_filter_42_12]PJC52957.1 MAG: preprotein translocase subunit SecE [Candidatus Magasanikbacteria bacterium CG_4_9_14_0_2_um_filter_42_11]
MIKKLTAYFREAFYELRKVTWPTKKQTINYSIVVIVIAISMAIFFAVLDDVFTWLLSIVV